MWQLEFNQRSKVNQLFIKQLYLLLSHNKETKFTHPKAPLLGISQGCWSPTPYAPLSQTQHCLGVSSPPALSGYPADKAELSQSVALRGGMSQAGDQLDPETSLVVSVRIFMLASLVEIVEKTVI